MEVIIKNFGTLKSADVHVGGLTVITGENDTGKSTVGKMLFSLVKGVARYEEDLEELKEDRVTDEAEKIYFSIRRHVNIASHEEFRDLFHPRKLYGQFKLDRNRAYQERIVVLNTMLERGELSPEASAFYLESLQKILAIISEPDDPQYAIGRGIKKSFFSEFKDEILPKGGEESVTASIDITDGASELLSISWQKDGAEEFRYVDDLGYSDATYVDSPAIMQYHHMVKMARTLFENDSSRLTVPLHVKDLSNKLGDSKYSMRLFADLLESPPEFMQISSRINDLFNGEMSYDDDASDFVLRRSGVSVSSANVASGIKALAVLGMLIGGGSIKKNTLLVLDEPEVNLHPRWQVEYCKIVCDVVAAGVDVIVTTHSPYVVEALHHYSKNQDYWSSFYLASRVSPWEAELHNITDDISIAIERLAAPLEKINLDYIDDIFK